MPRDRDLSATDIPSTYVPARNTIFLSLALGWAEVLGAHRYRHRRQRARLLGLSRLPARVHRRVRDAGDARDAGRRRGRALRSPHAAHHDDEGRDHPRGLALGLDYGLTHSCYDPVAGRRAVRPLRQLRAAREGICRSRRPRSGAGRARSPTRRADDRNASITTTRHPRSSTPPCVRADPRGERTRGVARSHRFYPTIRRAAV